MKTKDKTASKAPSKSTSASNGRSSKTPKLQNSITPSSGGPRRLEDIARGRAGCFPITPTLIQPEDGFNSRDDLGDLEALAADIEANGLQQPLKIRKERGSENIWLIDGHRRHAAITTILIPQNRWGADKDDPKLPAPVECTCEKPGTKPVDRLFMQLSMNTGKPFTFLEEARLYQRILKEDPNLLAVDIARRTGKTKQAISDSLRLVNEGSDILFDAIRDGMLAASTALAIIKQAGADHEAQEELYDAACEAAEESGRPGHVMPKDIPQPEGKSAGYGEISEDEHWSYQASTDYGWNQHKVATTPTRIIAKFPAKCKFSLELLVAESKAGTWHAAYHYRLSTGSMSGGGGLPAKSSHCTYPDEASAILAAYESTATSIRDVMQRNPRASSIKEAAITLGYALHARFPTGRSFDESIFDLTPDTSDSSDLQSPISDLQSAEGDDPRFTLYCLTGVPTEPVDEDQPFYHETDRLVIENPPEGIHLMHLLSAVTPHGIAYGYRLNDHTHLPDVSDMESLDEAPDSGYELALEWAMKLHGTSGHDLHHDLSEALTDAIFRYFPETGNPEEPERLPYVAIEDAPAKQLSGYEAIKAAPTTHRDGSSGGGPGNGFAPPDKRMTDIEAILDGLDKDGKGDEERITTTEIVLAVLRNERPPADLKKHLLGD